MAKVDGNRALATGWSALGMALLASQHLPELKEVIIPVAIGSTIIFELIGPVMTRKALIKAAKVRRTMNRDLITNEKSLQHLFLNIDSYDHLGVELEYTLGASS